MWRPFSTFSNLPISTSLPTFAKFLTKYQEMSQSIDDPNDDIRPPVKWICDQATIGWSDHWKLESFNPPEMIICGEQGQPLKPNQQQSKARSAAVFHSQNNPEARFQLWLNVRSSHKCSRLLLEGDFRRVEAHVNGQYESSGYSKLLDQRERRWLSLTLHSGWKSYVSGGKTSGEHSEQILDWKEAIDKNNKANDCHSAYGNQVRLTFPQVVNRIEISRILLHCIEVSGPISYVSTDQMMLQAGLAALGLASSKRSNEAPSMASLMKTMVGGNVAAFGVGYLSKNCQEATSHHQPSKQRAAGVTTAEEEMVVSKKTQAGNIPNQSSLALQLESVLQRQLEPVLQRLDQIENRLACIEKCLPNPDCLNASSHTD